MPSENVCFEDCGFFFDNVMYNAIVSESSRFSMLEINSAGLSKFKIKIQE